MAVLLLRGVPEQVSLGHRSATALAGLGVTHVTLVSDGATAGLVLEGWAFDPERAQEAATAVGAVAGSTLASLVQMAVSTAQSEGVRE